MMKLLSFTLMAVAVFSQASGINLPLRRQRSPLTYRPQPAFSSSPEPKYNPTPVYKRNSGYKQEVYEQPQPFSYEYGGQDEYGHQFSKSEAQDEKGTVHGEYRVELPDGRTQIVTYSADEISGFVADVKYEGEARPYVQPPPKQRKKPGKPTFSRDPSYYEPKNIYGSG